MVFQDFQVKVEYQGFLVLVVNLVLQVYQELQESVESLDYQE